MAHYLVTGGAGFIGSHLVEALSKSGEEVTILDNLSTGKISNIRASLGGKVQLVEGDIRDTELLKKLLQGCRGVFHLAALVSVPHSIEQPNDSFDINLRGTVNLLECCRKQERIRVVFASSAAVYGNVKMCPVKENAPVAPLSPYGLHKYMCEEHADLYGRLYGLNSVGLRFFNVFGPRQDPSSAYSGVISIFIDQLTKSKSPRIFGDGKQIRDFVYVGDVVQALLKAMNAQHDGFTVYNVGRGKGTSINDLWSILCEVESKTLDPIFDPERPGEIRTSIADISRISAELGYLPNTELESGLKNTYQWAKEYKDNNFQCGSSASPAKN